MNFFFWASICFLVSLSSSCASNKAISSFFWSILALISLAYNCLIECWYFSSKSYSWFYASWLSSSLVVNFAFNSSIWTFDYSSCCFNSSLSFWIASGSTTSTGSAASVASAGYPWADSKSSLSFWDGAADPDLFVASTSRLSMATLSSVGPLSSLAAAGSSLFSA